MKFVILTLFPDMFPGTLGFSVAQKAYERKLWSYETINIYDFAINNKIDDIEFGGGGGMIIRYDVLHSVLSYAYKKYNISKSFYTSPRGILFDNKIAHEITKEYTNKEILILCGRFEGIDQRAIDEFQLEEISIGNYILSGGDLACLVIMDSIIRLLPGVITKQENIINESFNKKGSENTLEHDLYTKPREFKGRKVPEVLFSGNHKKIEEWKINNSKTLSR